MNKYPYGSTLITGGAGFIGSHLVDKLVSEDVDVVALDNLATGIMENMSLSNGKKNFRFIKEDLNNHDAVKKSLDGIDTVFHMAADPEVRTGFENPESSYKENIRNTFYLLEQIRKSSVKRIVFASSSAVYGDASILPTPENYGPLFPISAYGASKLACEAYVASYCNNHGIQGVIIRPANVIGGRGRHGVTWDFVNRLKQDKTQLTVLGDGKQTKSYIHISDGISGILTGLTRSKNKVDVFNLGSQDRVEVMKIAEVVCRNMNLSETKIKTTGGVDGGRGWIGDIKYAHLDITKLMDLGWKPILSSEESVDRASKEIIASIT